MDKEKRSINCGTHGKRVPAYVCRHLVNKLDDRVLGFVENCSDPEDLQAWCDDCERLFLDQGEMTAEFIEFNKLKVVCDFCYAKIKTIHTKVV